MLFDHPTPFFFVLLFALSVFVEIEHRAGMRLSVDTDSLRHEQLVAARDAIGLLLILLLGFTLARAIARFDQRKRLLVNEANSISTTAWRARTLPEPVNTKVFGLPREYVDARARFSAARLEGKTWSSPSSQRNIFRTSCGIKPFSWQKPHQPRSPLLLFSRLTRPST